MTLILKGTLQAGNTTDTSGIIETRNAKVEDDNGGVRFVHVNMYATYAVVTVTLIKVHVQMYTEEIRIFSKSNSDATSQIIAESEFGDMPNLKEDATNFTCFTQQPFQVNPDKNDDATRYSYNCSVTVQYSSEKTLLFGLSLPPDMGTTVPNYISGTVNFIVPLKAGWHQA